jgi:hypothetical protein
MKIEKPKSGIEYYLWEVTWLPVLYLRSCKSQKKDPKKDLKNPWILQ